MSRARRAADRGSALRKRAERQVRGRRAPATPADAGDLRRLVHELEVHQVELELQNRELRNTQVELAATRDRYESLFSEAPIAYLVLDRAGTILEANDAACALLHSPRPRLLRRPLVSFAQRDDRSALARHLAEATATIDRIRPLRVTLDGPPFRVARVEAVRESPAPNGRQDYRVTMVDVTAQVLSEQRLRGERTALERSQTALRLVTRRLMTAEEEERRRIAADLHDDIGQRLHAVQLELALLERRSSRTAEWSTRVTTIRRRLEAIVSDLDGLARTLHPKIVEHLGLRIALKAYAADLERQTGIAVRVRDRGVPDAIPADVSTALYRVAQEALRNVHRHAAARAAAMTLVRVRGGLGLCVADSGRGFDPEQVRQSSRGFGLLTMDERIRALDGHFRVRTNPGDGTHVHAWLPLHGESR